MQTLPFIVFWDIFSSAFRIENEILFPETSASLQK